MDMLWLVLEKITVRASNTPTHLHSGLKNVKQQKKYQPMSTFNIKYHLNVFVDSETDMCCLVFALQK